MHCGPFIRLTSASFEHEPADPVKSFPLLTMCVANCFDRHACMHLIVGVRHELSAAQTGPSDSCLFWKLEQDLISSAPRDHWAGWPLVGALAKMH